VVGHGAVGAQRLEPRKICRVRQSVLRVVDDLVLGRRLIAAAKGPATELAGPFQILGDGLHIGPVLVRGIGLRSRYVRLVLAIGVAADRLGVSLILAVGIGLDLRVARI
jgi:hypothetical protein